MNDSVALAPPKTFWIGDWEIDPGACVLRRRADGSAVKVTPRSMDVLVYLAGHAGEVVTGDELLDRFWPSPMAASNAVYKSVTELRHAFSDKPRDAAYIETVPKRGYRLIASVDYTLPPISLEPNTLITSTRNRRFASIAVSIALLLAVFVLITYLLRSTGEPASPQQRIAILPLQVFDNDATSASIAEGLVNSLMDGLARLRHVHVTSPKLSLRPRLESLSTAEIGEALEANHILSGALQRDGDNVEIHVELIRTEDDARVYEEEFYEQVEDPLALEDDVADRIVTSLEVLLDERHRQRMQAWGTEWVAAYLDAEDAMSEAHLADPRSLEQAAASYRRAIAADPGFLKAQCRLAGILSSLGYFSTDANERNALRTELIELRDRIVQIDGNAACLAKIENDEITLRQPMLRALETRLHQLITAQPESAEYYSTYHRLLWTGRLFDEAAEYVAKYQRHYLNASEVRYPLLLLSYLEGHQSVINRAEAALGDSPNNIELLYELVLHHAALGEFGEAEVYLSHLRTNDPAGHWAYAAELELRALRGELTKGSETLASALRDDRATNFARGTACFLLGDTDQGVTYWQQMEPGVIHLAALYVPELEFLFPENVTRDPHYQAVLDELGIGKTWQQFLRAKLMELAPITGILPRDTEAVANSLEARHDRGT